MKVFPPVGQPTIFVDSVAGDDTANGLTPETAFSTLERASQGLTSQHNVFLKCGSRFREELTDWVGGVSINAYGAGDRPIVDGRDIADNDDFNKTGGRTNVYEISWAHGFGDDGGKSKHRVWEADVMMVRAASLAACDSTPGSFYAATPTEGGPDTVYVHTTASGVPTLEYAITKRRWCVQLYESYNQVRITSVETIGNSYADGSLCIDGYAEDCIARDGRIHNAFILGEAYNCQALSIEPGSTTMFVTYVDVGNFGGPSGRNVLYRNCLADAETTTEGGTGFFVHTDGVRVLGTIEYRDCRVVGCEFGWAGSQAQKFVAYRCTYEDVTNAYGLYGADGTYLLGGSGSTRAGSYDGGLVFTNDPSAAISIVVHGAKVHCLNSLGPVFINSPNAVVSMERCTMTAPDLALLKFHAGDITFRNNATYKAVIKLGLTGAQIEAFDADYNCYWRVEVSNAIHSKLVTPAEDFFTIVDWRAYLASVDLGIGQEVNSIAQDPLITGAADLDFTIHNATVTGMGCGAEVDEEDDPVLQAYWLANRVTEV